MAGEEFLFEGIRQFGAGLQGASENLAKQAERVKKAKATQKFLEANSEMLGMDPEAIRNFGVAETEAATDFLFKMAPINQAQERINQQQSILDAQAAAKRAEADIFADAFTQTPVETSRDAVVFGSLQQPIPQVTGADLDIIESLRRPAPQVDMTFTQADVPLAPATEAVIQPKQERPISGIESVAKTLREQPSFLDFIGDLIPKLSEKDIDKAKELMGVQSETDKVVSNFLRKEKTRAKKREELKPVTDTVGVLRPDPLPARPIPASTFDAPIPEAPAQSDFQTQAVKDIVFQSAVEAAGGVDEFLAQNRDRLAQAGDIGKLRESIMSATGERTFDQELDLLKLQRDFAVADARERRMIQKDAIDLAKFNNKNFDRQQKAVNKSIKSAAGLENMNRTVDQIVDIFENEWGDPFGKENVIMSTIAPWTTDRDTINALNNQFLADAAFTQLLDIKANDATLGQVSNIELELLKSAEASLDPNLPADIYFDNLARHMVLRKEKLNQAIDIAESSGAIVPQSVKDQANEQIHPFLANRVGLSDSQGIEGFTIKQIN